MGFGCWRNAHKKVLDGENTVREEEVSGLETTVSIFGFVMLLLCLCVSKLFDL